MKRLSLLQLGTLDRLSEGPLTSTMAMLAVGYTFRKTLGSLVDRGFARYFPYGYGKEGCWKITRAGRKQLEDESAWTSTR